VIEGLPLNLAEVSLHNLEVLFEVGFKSNHSSSEAGGNAEPRALATQGTMSSVLWL
jgi:hypothetical protein